MSPLQALTLYATITVSNSALIPTLSIFESQNGGRKGS